MSEFDKSVYNEHYYDTSFGGIPYNRDSHQGHWIQFFGSIAEYINNNYKLTRTLDVGCAKGFLVEALRDRGINAFGFDISETAHEEIREDIKPYCSVGSIDDPSLYNKLYDMIFCIEVLEHVTEEMALKTIELMCKHTDQILFSSSPSDFEEPTHINVQPPEYWDELFARFGFVRAHEEWPSQIVAPHTLIYRKKVVENILLTQKEQQELNEQHVELNKVLNSEIVNKLDSLNIITKQIDNLSEENLLLKEKINGHIEKEQNLSKEKSLTVDEVNSLKEERSHLAYTISSLNVKNHELLDEMNRIKNGKTFRVMNKYWKYRDKALPLGSKRRELVKSITRLRKMQTPPVVNSISTDIVQNYETQLWDQGFQAWLKQTKELTIDELSEQREASKRLKYQPLISILLPVYIIPVDVFKETINSVLNQSYENWELCLALADISQVEVVEYVKSIEKQYPQVKVSYLETNGGISSNTNECLRLAEGDFIALLDHDDLITPDALFVMLQYINEEEEADFLYSDKDQINEAGTVRLNPLFKHQWSWPTMLSANYPTHFCMIRKSLFEKIGEFDTTTDGAQDWDIFLKASEKSRKIIHVPEVLYHWRIIQTSVASGLQAKPYVIEAQNKALANYVQRRNFDCELIRNDDHSFYIKWNNTNAVNYDLMLYTNGHSESDVIHSLESIIKQQHIPNKVYILSELPFSMYLDKYQKYMSIEVKIYSTNLQKELKDLVYNSDSESIAFWEAGLAVANSRALTDLLGWNIFGGYAAVSGKIIDKDSRIVNAGYVVKNGKEWIQPYKNMPDYAYTTYGSVNWYREYMAVSEKAIMFNKASLLKALDHMSDAIHISELILSTQLQLTNNLNQKILYDPHAIFTMKETNEEAPTFVITNPIIDLYFNKSVWDWNPDYLRNNYLPVVSESSSKNNSSIWDGYTSDAMVLGNLYDFTNKDLQKNRELINSIKENSDIKTAVWFLPPFSTAFYGGIYTIFRFADYMSKNFGVTNKFAIVGTEDIEPVKKAIVAAFPGFQDAEVFSLVNDTKLSQIPDSDIAFCTLWTTAYSLLKYNRTKQKFYFLQDWEPLFYPAGSTSAQTEATFRFGFKAICNTQALEISYKELGGEAISFTPSIDTKVFYPRSGERPEDPYLVFLYGRPGNPRNCFELAIPALKKVKKHFGDKVKIISAGADWDPNLYGAEGIIEHLGMLPYEATGDLYRQCHVGLAMMMTRHPSYLPFELMGCGCLVVANTNSWNEWMLKDNENCRVTEPSVSCIADTIIESLINKEERIRITNNASTYISAERSDWNNEFERLFDKLSLF